MVGASIEQSMSIEELWDKVGCDPMFSIHGIKHASGPPRYIVLGHSRGD